MKYFTLLLSICFLFTSNAQAQISQEDSLALVHLYNSTDGPNWTNNDNWLSGPVHTWYGITIVNNRVTKIELYNNNLTGLFPDTITSLTELETLYLNTNTLSGELPIDLGRLTALRYLQINSNEIEGMIPESIGNCANLQNLRINNNNLTGSFPLSLSNLNNLTFLVAYKNNFSGPFPEVLLMMKQLHVLDISTNNFTGQIPRDINTMVNLKNLDLHYNDFTGSMPKVDSLVNLIDLHLSGLNVEGHLDTILGYHPNMSYITANFSQFSGRISTQHFNPDKLNYLHLNGNHFSEIDDFTSFANNGIFQRLYVRENALDFDDLAPNAQLPNLINFQYDSQASLGETDIIYLNNGENYTINSPMQNPMIQYYWLKDGDTIQNASGPSYTIDDFDNSKEGVYTFHSTHLDFPGLVIEHAPITILDSLSTSSQQLSTSNWKLSPNPVSDQIFISMVGDYDSRVEIRVFNIQGQLICRKNGYGPLHLDCSNWLPGLYTVRLQVNGKIGVKSFVKQ